MNKIIVEVTRLDGEKQLVGVAAVESVAADEKQNRATITYKAGTELKCKLSPAVKELIAALGNP